MAIEPRGGQESKPKVFGKWGTLNTKVDRSALAEDEAAWLENLFPIAPGDLRTLYAEASTTYTTINPRTIIALYPYNLGATTYVALFLDDGSAVQIQTSNGASTSIGTAGTFYSGGTLPTCSQYQSKYLIIGSDVSANAYWVWDGTSLFGAGTLSPQVTVISGGQNYTSSPSLTATGGSGTGATFSTTVANGVVTDAVCTNGGTGYKLGEKVTLSFSGGGSDTEARATAWVTDVGAAVGAINITSGGTAFTGAATVAVSGGRPTPATAGGTVTAVGGVIQSINVTTHGLGYFTAGLVDFSLPGGAGTGAVLKATLGTDSSIVSIAVVSGGTGYQNSFATTFATGDPAPRQATAISIVSNGVVTGVIVTDAGFGYTSQPTVSVSGAGGSGATAIAQLVKGQISVVKINNAGTNYLGVPTITISSPDDPTAIIPTTATATANITSNTVSAINLSSNGCGYLQANVDIRGGNNCAHATAELMPFGIKATAIETYNNQVWTTTGTKMSLTGPNSISDFSTFGGGGSAPATDSFLRRTLVGLKQDSGFLYRFADSSVNVITNVQTSSLGITTYNNSNIDTQTGTIWRDTICAFDRAIVFANTTGVYALFGGAVQKVSDQLDGLFEKASFNTGQAGVIPTAAVTTLFGVRCYCLLFTTTDPYSGTLRTLMACWDGKKWFCATQTKTLTLVGLQEIDSVFTAWGTDGTRLFKLFQTASTSLTKVWQSRLDGAAQPDLNWRIDNLYGTVNLLSGSSATLNITADTDATVASTLKPFTLVAGRQTFAGNAQPGGAVYATLRGLTVTTTAADLQLIAVEVMESEYSKGQ